MSILGNDLLAQYYAQNQGILPPEYQQVEYLESSGTQRIDTVFKATEKTKVIIDFQMDSLGKWVFGSRNEANPIDRFCMFVFYEGDIYPIIGIALPRISVSFSTGVRHVVEMSLYGGVVFDGNIVYEYTQTEKQHNFTSTYPLSLLTMRNGASSYNAYMSGRIYSFTAVENSLYVCNFIPCVRISDNKPGMYDLCKSICPLTGNSFYINAGTGEFVIPT